MGFCPVNRKAKSEFRNGTMLESDAFQGVVNVQPWWEEC